MATFKSSFAVACTGALRRPTVQSGGVAPVQPAVTQVPARRPTVATRAIREPSGGDDLGSQVAKLNQLIATPSITGTELRQLVVNKWGRSYDVRLTRRDRKMYLQVMWKFLEQQSFPLSEAEYQEQLDAVAYFLNQWGAADTVRQGIAAARSRGPGYTGGTSARCISIPLDVDLSGARGSEWN